MTSATALLGLTLLTATAGSLAATEFAVEELPLAAAEGSATPSVAAAIDGSLFVSWTEPAESRSMALRISRFDRTSDRWTEPTTVASGPDWFISAMDPPIIAAGLRGRLAAAWYAQNADQSYHALISTSADQGQSWSAPQRLTSESSRQEFVQLAPLLNGSWLALWLDGRDPTATQLRSRVIGDEAPDTLVDDRVCDCCPISPLVLPNGAVLTAYRDRSEEEIRDIAYQTYSRGTWTPMNPPLADGWVIEGCPVNGPHLSRRSGNVAAAWFTAADVTPRVWVARSPNLGRSWSTVTRIDDPAQTALGSPNVAVLRDGTHWISWLETGGGLALRALHREGTLGAVFRLNGPSHGGVQLRVLNNRSDQAAQLLMVLQRDGRVVTEIVTLPYDGEPTIDDCGCSPAEAAARGHAFRGRIVSLLPDQNALLIEHEEVPGVMMAMTMAFPVDPRVLAAVRPGQEITARMERRDDQQWWLFSIRIVSGGD